MRPALALLLVAGLFAMGNTQSDTGAKPGTLSVTGSASVTVEPDVAKIYVSVTVGKDTVKEACDTASQTTADVIAAVEGVEGVNVTTDNISVQPNITYGMDGQQTMNGFICQQSLQIKVTETADGETGLDASISDALDAALKAGGDYLQVSSMMVDLSEDLRREATNQAREAAVQDAAETANILSKAAKVTLGGIRSIVDSNFAPPSPIPLATPLNKGGMEAAAAVASTPVQTGTTDVTATVNIVYSIQNA